jgi:hypothetical protein
LGCFILPIHIRIVAILTLIPVDITDSQVNPVVFSRGLSSPAGSGHGIPHVAFVTFILGIPAECRLPKLKIVVQAIIRYCNFSVSASDLRLLKRDFRGQIIKKNTIVNTLLPH